MASGIVVMAIVCGGLMIFFLTPTKREAIIDNQQKSKMSFAEALKYSSIQTLFHKKAILAFLQLVITLIIIWQYHADLEWYNSAHGVISAVNPTKQAVLYMIAVTVYAVMIYLILVLRGMKKLINKSGQ